MVEKMTKYSFILLDEETEGFLLQLQELGVVDITRSRKPIDEDSAAMLEKAGAEKRALTILRKTDFKEDPDREAIKAAAGTAECRGDYSTEAIEAEARLKDLQTALYNARKTAKAKQWLPHWHWRRVSAHWHIADAALSKPMHNCNKCSPDMVPLMQMPVKRFTTRHDCYRHLPRMRQCAAMWKYWNVRHRNRRRPTCFATLPCGMQQRATQPRPKSGCKRHTT